VRAVTLCLLLLPARAEAQGDISCLPSSTAYVETVGTGDVFYFNSGRNWCGSGSSDLRGRFWSDFGLDRAGESEQWRGPWGGSSPCDVRSPAGRLFNALYLLASRPTLLPYYRVAKDKIDDLDAVCWIEGNRDKIATSGTCFFSNWTQLSYNFFYGWGFSETGSSGNYPVWARAATIAHEARHYADGVNGCGYGHVECWYDRSFQQCDDQFTPPAPAIAEPGTVRPNSYTVDVLLRYAALGPSEPRMFRENARVRAQWYLDWRFNYVPPEWDELPPLPPDPTAAPVVCSPPQVLQYFAAFFDDAGNQQPISYGLACAQCPLGSGPTSDATGCTSCAPGEYSFRGVCTKCPAGTYAPAPVAYADSCTQCPPGTWSATVGATDPSQCQPCQAGEYSEQWGRTTACDLCPANTFNPSLRQSACQNCPLSTPSSNPGSTSSMQCMGCPAGQGGTPTMGGVTCGLCAWGTYSPGGTAPCMPCPAGFYQDQPQQADCKPCPLGQVSTAGQRSCWPCSGGRYANLWATQCAGCPPYHVSSPKNVCVGCPAGQVPTDDKTACVVCSSPPCATTPCGAFQQPNVAGDQCIFACPAGYTPDATFAGCVFNPS
jgi:hypothetical protein